MHAYRCRRIDPQEYEPLIPLLRRSEYFDLVLRYRYGNVEAFFADALAAPRRAVLCAGGEAGMPAPGAVPHWRTEPRRARSLGREERRPKLLVATEGGATKWTRPAAGVATEANAGQPLGWAACFEFHPRAGYAGVAQIVVDVPDPRHAGGLGRALLASCEEACRALRWRTLVGFAHTRIAGSAEWHAANGFVHSGRICLDGGAELHAFCKELAP